MMRKVVPVTTDILPGLTSSAPGVASKSFNISRRLRMPHLILAGVLMFVSSISRGQTTISAGTTLKVLPGTSLTSGGSLNLRNGAAVNGQGTLILKHDLSNLNPGANSLGSGIVTFSGTNGQTVSGQNVIQEMIVNNWSGLTLTGNTRVNGFLELTNGIVNLGASNLTLGIDAVVSGFPNVDAMVEGSGTGQFRKEFDSPGSFTFPVGTGTEGYQYSPVTLSFNNGTFGPGSYAGVNLSYTQYPGTETSYLTRYWNVAQSGITEFTADATFEYDDWDVTGNEWDLFTFKVDPALPWTAYNQADGDFNLLTAHGLSSFGTFTGNLGNGQVPPPIRSLQDKTISSGIGSCADAQQTMIIAGNGTSYIVEPGGSMTHIAGQRISYLPGTKVQSGGYLHGYISNTFCNPYNHPAAAVIAGNGEQPDPLKQENSTFMIYPNPTSGRFTLELKGDAPPSQVHVEIFSILGEKIQSTELPVERKQVFSLADKPSGVYVVHVSSGAYSETQKIIKR